VQNKMWKVNGQTTDAKWWQKLKLPLARWGKKLSGISKILLKELFFFNYNISVPQLPLYNAQKFTKVPYFYNSKCKISDKWFYDLKKEWNTLFLLNNAGFMKLHMGLVVLVKKCQSSLISIAKFNVSYKVLIIKDLKMSWDIVFCKYLPLLRK
jgi:hypothetical protein